MLIFQQTGRFVKGEFFCVIPQGEAHGVIPQGEAHGVIPQGETPFVIPQGEALSGPALLAIVASFGARDSRSRHSLRECGMTRTCATAG
jgi:hypothetical protein